MHRFLHQIAQSDIVFIHELFHIGSAWFEALRDLREISFTDRVALLEGIIGYLQLDLFPRQLGIQLVPLHLPHSFTDTSIILQSLQHDCFLVRQSTSNVSLDASDRPIHLDRQKDLSVTDLLDGHRPLLLIVHHSAILAPPLYLQHLR